MQSFKVFWESRNPLNRLYHKTGTKSLLDILGSNEFKLTVINSEFERFKIDRRTKKYYSRNTPVYNYKKNYYMSTARSMYNFYYNIGYHRPFAILELDGSKISDKYEIIPVEYWHVSNTSERSRDETEDRIISTKPTIRDASKYITRIFIYRGDQNEIEQKRIDVAVNSGIPVYVFRNVNDLFLKNIKKAEPQETHNQEVSPREYYVHPDSPDTKKKIKELEDLYNFITNPTIENREKIKHTITSADEMFYNTSNSKVQEIREVVFKFQELQRKTNKSLKELLKNAIEEFDKRYNR